MGSLCPLLFPVNRFEPELITPAKPTPIETKQLSDIDDQDGLRFHFPVIISYKNNPSMKGNDAVMVIREALSRALVYYYPLAGRLREGPNRKLMVECNGEGVLFIEANADVTLEQLGDRILPPCPVLEEFLSNPPGSDGILGCPLLLVQVTRLTCGGFIFGLRINHAMCDAVGLAKFLNAIGEMAQGADSLSVPPVWARELLNARDPPTVTRWHYEYDQLLDSQGSFIAAIDQSNMAQRSFYFGPQQIRALRKHLPPHLSTCSSFELITACVWRCRTLSLRLNPKDTVRISCAVNARGKSINDLCLPSGFYGNAFSIPTAVSTVELLCASPLGYGVELVRKSKAQMDKEYMQSLADFFVIRGRPPLPMGWNVFIVSDNRHTGFGEFDVGWGRPLFAGLARAFSMISFYVRDNNQEEEFGTLVPICLPSTSLERFEEELKKMTLEHVEEISK
ncbi:hypothetical protein PRUPE_5G018200 [Prunus persica]|uniref:Alcohol acyl transferase n=1 Tax=Prunus persica TaxID=3760 RepID=M5WU76_PRUPE|nr:methanol O-anthraniloyltransferase [Prunus persica]ONI05667.1 hypothetical protein PRUPE_5G018200 [Prunus persica]QEZ90730.1 alcohol acyl transferase [Prunus persica]QEZ90731.1 alcohol acyl transferase [Prunus persica]